VNYVWGLGSISNNLAEAYSLWCGLNIAKETRIKALTVLGDSLLIVRAINEQRCPSRNKLNAILKSIVRTTKKFSQIRFVCIKRALNVEVDIWAKLAREILALFFFVESGNRGFGQSLFFWLDFEAVSQGALDEN
jgi:ribonuclease HI